MRHLLDALAAYFSAVAGWGRSADRESVVEAVSTGPCGRCGEERLRVRDVRVDDLGYSVRVRDGWSCGCDDDPGEPATRSDPGVVA